MPSTRRNGAYAMSLAACVFLSGCSGSASNSEGGTVDAEQFRATTIATMKQIVAVTGVKLTSANYNLSSCLDGSAGNSWRAEVTGNYDSGASLAESQATIGRWAASLKRHGWAHQPGTITHNGLVISRDGGTVRFDYQDKSFVDPPPSFTYDGPCHPLPSSEIDTDGNGPVHSILGDIG